MEFYLRIYFTSRIYTNDVLKKVSTELLLHRFNALCFLNTKGVNDMAENLEF